MVWVVVEFHCSMVVVVGWIVVVVAVGDSTLIARLSIELIPSTVISKPIAMATSVISDSAMVLVSIRVPS